jgi:hypothetical protein
MSNPSNTSNAVVNDDQDWHPRLSSSYPALIMVTVTVEVVIEEEERYA